METEEIQLDREDVLLMILEANERVLHKDWLNGITRLEKLLFLLERETDFKGVGEFFRFKAHNFGPFSKEVYEAVEFLTSCDLIEVREKAFPTVYSSSDEATLLSEICENELPDDGEIEAQVTEKQFALTDNGRKVAEIMRAAVHRLRPSDTDKLDDIVRRYGPRPLNQLIRYVYRQHPEMTVNSIHPEARNIQDAKH